VLSKEVFVRYLSLRYKLLIGFTLVFTLIFAGAYYWFYSFSTEEALDRITEDLVGTMQAAADGIDGNQLQQLFDEGVLREDGYTDDARYWDQVDWLGTVHNIEPRAALYTYRAGEEPNELIFITSSGAVADPPFGATFRESWIPDSADEIASNMAGLQATTLQTKGRAGCTYGAKGCRLQPYGDQWGQWVSAFTPVTNSNGEVVAALGVDFQADYVREVQDSIRSRTLVAFGITYAVLFALVYSLSSLITRPIKMLTDVAERIGEADYDRPGLRDHGRQGIPTRTVAPTAGGGTAYRDRRSPSPEGRRRYCRDRFLPRAPREGPGHEISPGSAGNIGRRCIRGE
jgi:hypothetical protein